MAGLYPATRSFTRAPAETLGPRVTPGDEGARGRGSTDAKGEGGAAGLSKPGRRNGAACQTRTDDLRITNAMLYQLS